MYIDRHRVFLDKFHRRPHRRLHQGFGSIFRPDHNICNDTPLIDRPIAKEKYLKEFRIDQDKINLSNFFMIAFGEFIQHTLSI